MSYLGRINNDHVEQNQSLVNTMVLDFKAMKTRSTKLQIQTISYGNENFLRNSEFFPRRCWRLPKCKDS